MVVATSQPPPLGLRSEVHVRVRVCCEHSHEVHLPHAPALAHALDEWGYESLHAKDPYRRCAHAPQPVGYRVHVHQVVEDCVSGLSSL